MSFSKSRVIPGLLLLSLLAAQSGTPVIRHEVRTRVIPGDLLTVVIQIENVSPHGIEEIQGFVTVRDQNFAIVSEKRLDILHAYEPILKPGASISRSLNYPFDARQSRSYTFHVSRLKFSGDHRVYTYHPAAGLIRID